MLGSRWSVKSQRYHATHDVIITLRFPSAVMRSLLQEEQKCWDMEEMKPNLPLWPAILNPCSMRTHIVGFSFVS